MQLLALLLLVLAAAGCGDSDGSPSDDGPSHVGFRLDAGSEREDAAAAGGEHPEAGGSGSGKTNNAGGTQGAAGSGGAMSGDKDASVTAPPLMVPELAPLPNCEAGGPGFDTVQPARGGQITMDFSSWLVPRGVNERAKIQVRNGKGDVDDGYNGNLTWTLPAGAEMVSSTPVVKGQAEATFHFENAGSVHVLAALDNDARNGFTDLIVYKPQLPIWELEVNPTDLQRIVANPDTWEEINGMLVAEGIPHPTILRLHGASSRYFPKKSFRFELSEMGKVTDTYGKKLLLRAEYNDKSLLRNWLALRMFRSNTRMPAPRSQLVHFRVNGRYYGVMHNVERIASHLLAYWGLPEDGSLYEADPEIMFSNNPGGNLTPIKPPENYPFVYQHQSGMVDFTDLRSFIEETLALPDAMFREVIERELVVDDYIDYMAMMSGIQNHDHVRKNYYLYRDPQRTAGWRVLPWDLDLSFGHLWSEQNDVLEEKIVSDADIFVGVHVPARGGFYNQLIDRMLTQQTYRTRFRARLSALMTGGLSRASAEALLNNALCRATPDIIADVQKRATNAEYPSRVAEIGEFLDARAAFVKAQP